MTNAPESSLADSPRGADPASASVCIRPPDTRTNRSGLAPMKLWPWPFAIENA